MMNECRVCGRRIVTMCQIGTGLCCRNCEKADAKARGIKDTQYYTTSQYLASQGFEANFESNGRPEKRPKRKKAS